MSDPATHPSPDTAEPVANGQAARPDLDAALARARRILEGDIRPDDYLPVTPEVKRLTDREMGYARARGAAAGYTGELDPAVEVRQLRQNLLRVHCRNQHIAYIKNDTGVVVVITGLEETGEMLRRLPGELWSERICVDYIDDDSAWLL
jgi:hypothetical protein